jgi:hypothetical protein
MQDNIVDFSPAQFHAGRESEGERKNTQTQKQHKNAMCGVFVYCQYTPKGCWFIFSCALIGAAYCMGK